MKIKSFILFALALCTAQVNAMHLTEQPDSLQQVNDSAVVKVHPTIINLDSVLHKVVTDSVVIPKKKVIEPRLHTNTTRKGRHTRTNLKVDKLAFDSLIQARRSITDSIRSLTMPTPQKVVIDSFVLAGNPLYIDLVYKEPELIFNWELDKDFRMLLYNTKTLGLSVEPLKTKFRKQSPEDFLISLRKETLDDITRTAFHLYRYTYEELPDPEGYKSKTLNNRNIDKIKFIDDEEVNKRSQRHINVKKAILSPWTKVANAMAQFSQNYVSSNWYQGGNSNVAILGILTAKLNFDNKKNIQWENYGEWRMGFNSVSGDTVRLLNVNDDVFKMSSKLGIRAGDGNWFYSTSVDFSTQLFNSYKGINSYVKKTAFLTPVRLNVGVGLDYKYKKILSLMVSPFSYKYIYANSNNVDPNLFGIKQGEKSLSEIGSSLKAQVSYPITPEIQLDSKLSFYTNYQKVEVDWEIVFNMTINRFMSTRLLLNPRYDNTVIEKDGNHAVPQFKQLLSVGFSHKL